MKIICLSLFILSILTGNISVCGAIELDNHCSETQHQVEQEHSAKVENEILKDVVHEQDNPLELPVHECEGNCHFHCHVLVDFKGKTNELAENTLAKDIVYPLFANQKTSGFNQRLNRPPIA